jgi:hypothetical protein
MAKVGETGLSVPGCLGLASLHTTAAAAIAAAEMGLLTVHQLVMWLLQRLTAATVQLDQQPTVRLQAQHTQQQQQQHNRLSKEAQQQCQ